MTSNARINPDGSIDLPAEMLERLGMTSGTEVTLEEIPGGIKLRLTSDEAIRRLQAWTREALKNAEINSVDTFIADRRRSAKQE
jgi:antitoxin component of MazEF toxin-antitoxin module